MTPSTPDAVEPGIYEHFKGQRYEVIGVGRHSETEEELVLYRQLYGEYGFWVRPLAMFLERVQHEGAEVPRFKRIA
ncbi:DUF1653 domain-containing protein [Microbacterium sp. NPDC019599]|uniref:DUF1653 domain-containing protein n=1 Tax=Microbacterium sp. NPDC019599 TaxID=3154690 RepID=UPI003400309A